VIAETKPSSKRPVPEPSVMPVDRNCWFRELHLSNFVNTYYQYRDLQSLGTCSRVLIIGPGQGLDTQVLRWRGYVVTTFDIDDTFQPDCIGSVHDLSQFRQQEFDAVIASHVLEHLPVPYLDKALQELARVARYALIYLPIHGKHFHFRLTPGIKDIDLSLVADIPLNPFERPDGETMKYMEGQHYWEIGMRGYRLKQIMKRMSACFKVISTYRNRDWISSQNFVLESRSMQEGRCALQETGEI